MSANTSDVKTLETDPISKIVSASILRGSSVRTPNEYMGLNARLATRHDDDRDQRDLWTHEIGTVMTIPFKPERPELLH
jgi:hypothetical protein